MEEDRAPEEVQPETCPASSGKMFYAEAAPRAEIHIRGYAQQVEWSEDGECDFSGRNSCIECKVDKGYLTEKVLSISVSSTRDLEHTVQYLNEFLK